MKTVTISGQCWVNFKKEIEFRTEEEASEFIKECEENIDNACCQIDVEDVTDIDCVDEADVSLTE